MNTSMGDAVIHMVLSLLVVCIGIVVVVALLKRMATLPLGGRKNPLNCIAALPIGPRQKILLIEVNGQQVLLGVTPHSITPLLLDGAPVALPVDNDAVATETAPAGSFFAQLGQVMSAGWPARQGKAAAVDHAETENHAQKAAQEESA